MKPLWVIESDVFPTDASELVEAIKRAGLEHKALNHTERYEKLSDFYKEELCAIFYGSLELAKHLQRNTRWIPGVYYNVGAYNCTSYYAALGKFLLNGNYIILPFNELRRQKEFLYEVLGQERTVFIRPNRGDKIFTGKLVYKEDFDKDIELFTFYEPKLDELVVVSEPRNLAFEWRFICVDGQVITGSQYRENERVAYDAKYPLEALVFAQAVAQSYNPDPVWVIDVCQTKAGEYRLMEVGCFSCCGLYNCDRDIIVKAVSEIAVKEWEDYQIKESNP